MIFKTVLTERTLDRSLIFFLSLFHLQNKTKKPQNFEKKWVLVKRFLPFNKTLLMTLNFQHLKHVKIIELTL